MKATITKDIPPKISELKKNKKTKKTKKQKPKKKPKIHISEETDGSYLFARLKLNGGDRGVIGWCDGAG